LITGIYGLLIYVANAKSFGYDFVPVFYENKNDNIFKRIFVKNIKEKNLIPYYIKNKN
jgi:hypothetical protein